MAGFLEGLGRSNALSSVNNMVGNAINIKKLENADEQTQHENAINMEKLGMLKAQSDREQTKFNREELQAKKQAEFLDAPVPISAILGPDYNTHPGKKLQFDYMLKNGMAKEVAPGVFTGTIGNAIEFKKQASADVAFYSTITEQTIQYTDSQLKKVDAAMSGDKDALKELGNLKPEELQAKKGELSKQLSDQVSASLRIDKKFQEQLALKKAEADNRSNKLTTASPGSDVLDAQGKVIHSVPARETHDNSEVIDIRRNQQEETARHNKEMERLNADKAKAGGATLGFADKEAIRAMGKQLPKSKVLAQTAEKNIQKIDRMAALVERGAGGVRGDLLAKINKVADLFRRTPPEDAKYNTLKSEMIGLAGSLRLQLGLVGQTSDRDVQIMQEAAGMGTPVESQKALLAGYRQGFEQDVSNYNSDAEAYSGYSKAGSSLYKPIVLKKSGVSDGASPQVAPIGIKATLPNGKVVTSDGKGGWQ